MEPKRKNLTMENTKFCMMGYIWGFLKFEEYVPVCRAWNNYVRIYNSVWVKDGQMLRRLGGKNIRVSNLSIEPKKNIYFKDVSNVKGLQKFGIYKCDLRDIDLSVMNLPHNLISLVLLDVEITDDQIKLLGHKLTELKVFYVNKCTHVTGIGLSDFVNLEKLTLHCCGVTDEALSGFVKRMTKLEMLNLCGCEKVTDKGLSCLVDLRVRELNIGGTNVEGVVLRNLVGLEALNVINSKITKKGMREIFGLSGIKKLSFSMCPDLFLSKYCIDDEDIEKLSNMSELYLNCKLTDRGFDWVCGIKGLRKLHVNMMYENFKDGNRLKSLEKAVDIEELHIDGHGMSNWHVENIFCRLKKLRVLELYECHEINHEGIKSMLECRELKELNFVGKHSITSEDKEMLESRGIICRAF